MSKGVGQLFYLSDDEDFLGKKKPKKKKEKKPKQKKLVAKVKVAIARKAYLTIVSLNALNEAKRLKRLYDKSPMTVKNAWAKFGTWEDLKKAMEKGTKQTIKGHGVGIVVTPAMIGLALAILKFMHDIFKKNKVEGDSKEIEDAENGMMQGEDALLTDRSIPKGTAELPEDKDWGFIKKNGKKKGDDETGLNLATNPISICFIILMLIWGMALSNPVLRIIAEPFALYALIGFFVIPFSEFGIAGSKVKAATRKYFDVPAAYFNKLTNILFHVR